MERERRFTASQKENGEVLRELRLDNMCTQLEVCTASGITRASLMWFEQGKHELKLSTIVKILDSIGYDLVIKPRATDDI